MLDADARPRIVVLGASAGGVEALSRLLSALPADLPAAVFVVLHVSPSAPPLLAKILARAARMRCDIAVDGEPIVAGRIYVAAPDRHLVLTADHVLLDRGPSQNRMRPAIDALFRSAAVHHGERVVGVILTGSLSDGSVGLAAVKRCGGVAIVQDPDDALFPDMPRNAIAADAPDLVVPLSEIPARIIEALGRRAPTASIPDALVLEAAPGVRLGAEAVADNDRIGERAALTCPDCGGPLWKLEHPTRFRCRIGHAYEHSLLVAAKTDEALHALWIAVRTLDERATMLSGMADTNRLADRTLSADQYMLRHDELRFAADAVRGLIGNVERPGTKSREEPDR